jgi:hypothetical protein
MTPAAKTTSSIGACSRRDALRKLDGRTRSAKYLRQIERELIEHLGGQATAPQRYLVERVAVDLLRLRLLDAEMAAGTVSDHNARIAHALRNSVRLALRELGPPAASPADQMDQQELLRRIVERHRRTGAAA